MGLFDSLKDIAMQNVNNALDKVKNDAEEKIKEEAREKSFEAVTGGIKSYLDNAEDRVPTEDGKEAVNLLKNIVEDTENMHNAGMSGDVEKNEEYVEKSKEDLQKIVEYSEKHNNNNNM